MNIKEYFTKKEKAFSNRKDKNFLLTSVILGVLFLVAIAIAKPQFYAFRNLSIDSHMQKSIYLVT